MSKSVFKSPEIEQFVTTGEIGASEFEEPASRSLSVVPEKPEARKATAKKDRKEPAQSITISLHSQDLKRLDQIEKALEKNGLLRSRGARKRLTTSELVRIAIAGFDPEQNNLSDLMDIAKRR